MTAAWGFTECTTPAPPSMYANSQILKLVQIYRMPSLLKCIQHEEQQLDFGVVGLHTAPATSGRKHLEKEYYTRLKDAKPRSFHAILDPNAEYWRELDAGLRGPKETEVQRPPTADAEAPQKSASPSRPRGILRTAALTCVFASCVR